MTYYAKANTAHPNTGLIFVGDVLTDKQAAALGKEMLDRMVQEGTLGTYSGISSTPSNERDPEETQGMSEENPDSANEAESLTGAGSEEDGQDALPELTLTSDMVSDGAQEAKDMKKTEEER